MKARKGFTLVEILIVVVILGILAAIVIPQFSQASTQAKENSLASNLQTMRSQISLYKIQHNDIAPPADGFVSAMTLCSNQDGDTAAVAGVDREAYPYGPYLQSIPNNPFVIGSPVAADNESLNAEHWVYDDTTGSISAPEEEAAAAEG